MSTDNKTLTDALTRFRCAGYDPTDGSGPIMVVDPEGPWVLAADVIGTGSDCEATPASPDAPKSGGDWFGDVLGSIGTVIPLADVQPGGRVRLGDGPKDGEVLVEVSGLTGSGKSAIAGEIEILCKTLGLEVEWVNGDEEKRLTHADWIGALEMYKPKVVIVEQNIPRAALAAQASQGGQGDALELLERYDWAVSALDAELNEGWDEGGRRARLQSDRDEVRAELIAALAARQPVGEPVAWKYQDKAADGVWEDRIGEKLPCWEHRNAVPLYATPSAQAVALGQFRKAVEAWKRDAQNKHRAGEIFPEQKDAIWKEADRLLALIDSHGARNG